MSERKVKNNGRYIRLSLRSDWLRSEIVALQWGDTDLGLKDATTLLETYQRELSGIWDELGLPADGSAKLYLQPIQNVASFG